MLAEVTWPMAFDTAFRMLGVIGFSWAVAWTVVKCKDRL